MSSTNKVHLKNIKDYCLFDSLSPGDIITMIDLEDVAYLYRRGEEETGRYAGYIVPGTINNSMQELMGIDLQIVVRQHTINWDPANLKLPLGIAPPAQVLSNNGRIRFAEYGVIPADSSHSDYDRQLNICSQYSFYNTMFKYKKPVSYISSRTDLPNHRIITFEEIMDEL